MNKVVLVYHILHVLWRTIFILVKEKMFRNLFQLTMKILLPLEHSLFSFTFTIQYLTIFIKNLVDDGFCASY